MAIVVGSGDIGSAIAVTLHRAGCGVVVCDAVDPSWPRRGMSFTNAWYVGNAELDGEGAVFCASLKSIPALVERRRLIAATTWSWTGVARALWPVAVVDATLWWQTGAVPAPPRDSIDALMVTVGATPGRPHGADVLIDVLEYQQTAPGGSVVVRASRSGRFGTRRRIGERVDEGEPVGEIGALQIRAPRTGVLRGLSANGARIVENAEILEIDPRGDPVLCYGMEPGPQSVGREVLRAFTLHGLLVDVEAHAAAPRAPRPTGRSSSDRPVLP